MQFLKAHYEKIILSLVLVGLAAAAALMPMKVAKERQKEEDRTAQLIKPKVKEYPPVDLSTNKAPLERLAQPGKVVLSGEHNLFNPVRWQKRTDGNLIKGTQTGLNAVKINDIKPLMLRLVYTGPSGEGEIKYTITHTKELESSRANKRVIAKGGKLMGITVVDVVGAVEDPSAVVVTLEGEKEPLTLEKNKPWERVMGYTADLVYEPENLKRVVKVKDEISFGGETYNIVAIKADEVVLSAKSNKKQSTLEFKTAQR